MSFHQLKHVTKQSIFTCSESVIVMTQFSLGKQTDASHQWFQQQEVQLQEVFPPPLHSSLLRRNRCFNTQHLLNCESTHWAFFLTLKLWWTKTFHFECLGDINNNISRRSHTLCMCGSGCVVSGLYRGGAIRAYALHCKSPRDNSNQKYGSKNGNSYFSDKRKWHKAAD